MKNSNRIKGNLNKYLSWPLYLSTIVIIMAATVLLYNLRAGIVASAFAALYIIISCLIYFRNKSKMIKNLVDFAADYAQVQRQLLKKLELPYALLDDTGRFVWQNEAFDKVFNDEKLFKKSVTSFIPQITRDDLPIDSTIVEITFSLENKDYRASLKKISLAELDNTGFIASGDVEGNLVSLFLFDETDINRYIKDNYDKSIITGIIYIDNYDEVMESVEDVRVSLLTALVDRKVNKYFSAYDALVKKTEKDRYVVVMTMKYFDQIVENKFEILEDVKTVNAGNEIAVTLSMGFGSGCNSINESTAYARNAIDLALGRGGDQAVVKTKDKISYFGGKSQQQEKNTRVKARVKAQALKEIIETKDRILVMGHANADIDVFGAAVGIYRATVACGKNCNIVINNVTEAIKNMMDGFKGNSEYPEDIFVNNSQALDLVDFGTALVIVDTNKPTITECPELLNKCKSIVVLDHHRQGSDRIENATLSYIEPYASSTCEMVAEILQYIGDNVKVKPHEADCLYGGIMIDTNNFMVKTGVRTFEAAAFLRRNGADVTRVRKIFRNDIEDYKARAEAVRNMELYADEFAISVCPAKGLDSPTVVGAQAANELLNISSVKASFVLTDYNDKIYISARSIDEINVQIIMENLGGGGHLSMAGAQLTDCTLDEAKEILKKTLDEMIENEEI